MYTAAQIRAPEGLSPQRAQIYDFVNPGGGGGGGGGGGLIIHYKILYPLHIKILVVLHGVADTDMFHSKVPFLHVS
ncbi:hypothetical protein ACJX0J_015230, partial [Zea mays]